jgi:hypothetical protein
VQTIRELVDPRIIRKKREAIYTRARTNYWMVGHGLCVTAGLKREVACNPRHYTDLCMHVRARQTGDDTGRLASCHRSPHRRAQQPGLCAFALSHATASRRRRRLRQRTSQQRLLATCGQQRQHAGPSAWRAEHAREGGSSTARARDRRVAALRHATRASGHPRRRGRVLAAARRGALAATAGPRQRRAAAQTDGQSYNPGSGRARSNGRRSRPWRLVCCACCCYRCWEGALVSLSCGLRGSAALRSLRHAAASLAVSSLSSSADGRYM